MGAVAQHRPPGAIYKRCVVQLLDYFVRVTPAFALGLALLFLLPRPLAGARLCVHIALFILVRDAMTPLGLWRLGAGPPFWLRLASDPAVLIGLAVASLGLVFGTYRLEPELSRGIVWWEGSKPRAIGAGLAGAVLIGLPVIALSFGTPISARGGVVASGLLLPLLLFSLCGNAYEELLFRGFLQGWLVQHTSAVRAVWLTGLAFAFGHVFLATTVTDAGWPVLAFTAYEGLVCAELRRRMGLAPAVLAHGGGIFLVASGLPW